MSGNNDNLISPPNVTGFVHLHLHTEYSLLDGAIRLKDLPDRLEEMGMTSCAITDHGVMYGVVDFYRRMKAKGLHPIIGCELYVAADSRFNRTYAANERYYHHLILLAKDNEGLKNLNRLCSAGFLEGFYRKPRIDKELLEKYHDGLICLSACIAGEISCDILSDNMDKAVSDALWYDSLFGRGNYYLEIQSNTMREQAIVNASLVKISRLTGIPLVATNDCHYLKSEDYEVHDVLLCMQTGAKRSDTDRFRMSTNDFYVKSETDIRRFFPDLSEAIENTTKIANMCNVEYDFNTIHLPEFDVPSGFNSNAEYLTSLAFSGLEEKFKSVPPKVPVEEYYKRIDYELSVINKMGYTDYYLIVWDFIFYAKSKGIMVGPGRGSGAGSLVAYAIGITNIDPLRYGLVFERFLNIERVSMPDFDIDFCYERRQEVIDYVTLKYGSERVAQVITYGTLQPRLCIRDVARVMDLPYATADKVAKMIPENLGITLDKALDMNSELMKEYESDENVRKIVDYSRKLEGMPRHTSTHAAGVIISGKPITDIAPLSVNDDNVVVQFAKYDIESVGLLKFDFLGLRTLTVMRDTADMVYENYNVKIDFDSIPTDEPEVYKMIGNGDTIGVFQLESRGMTSFMKELKPTSLEDIIAGISLYRPGPMDQIPKYVASKHDPSKISYDHPLLQPILEVTYGCMVYQEQVMQIVRDLAGFSMGQSDNIRRAMSKKNKALMEKYRKIFIYGGEDDSGNKVTGAVENGVPEEIADKIFSDVSNFAGYAFNKSHAAAYALVGYYTAYLKYHYPTEFMAAMMNSFRFNLSAAAWYISCCPSMNIRVLPPDINRSKAKFSTEKGEDGKRCIRIGLSVIKNVGEGAVESLVKERNANGPFRDFTDFLVRAGSCNLNKKMIESLIFSSALDFTGLTRASMIMTVQTELDKLNRNNSGRMEGQLSLFDMGDDQGLSSDQPSVDIKDVPEYSMEEKLYYEKDVLGIYISGHPLMGSKKYIDEFVTFGMNDVKEYKDSENMMAINDDKPVIMAGLLLKKQMRSTKAKTMMAVLQFEDLFGQYECAIFGKILERYNAILTANRSFLILGKRRVREDDTFSLYVDRIIPMPENDTEAELVRTDPFYRACLKDINPVSSFSKTYVTPPKEQVKATPEGKFTLPSSEEHFVAIRFNGEIGDASYNRLMNLLAYFHGNTKVKIYFPSTGHLRNVNPLCNIDDSPEVLEHIARLCGEDNITVN
ncbi:MAG: DNA polymerase III subunit alpha [Clostridiales bacterium]|nr:DNA polymerase III subunit alpha [Clostridiales bacterium]